jgi:hypothetical protein
MLLSLTEGFLVAETIRINRTAVFFELFFFSLLVAASVFLLKPLQNMVQTELTSLRDMVIEQAELFLQRDITYETMKTSFFGVLELKNVTVGDSSSDPVMSIPRMRVSWSLRQFLNLFLESGKTGGHIAELTQAITVIQLDKPFIAFDIERDADLIELFSTLSSGTDEQMVALASLIDERTVLKMKNATAVIALKSDNFTIDRLNAAVFVRNKRFFFDVKWDTAVTLGSIILGKIAPGTDTPLAASATMSAAGSCGFDFQDAAGRLTLSSFTSGLFVLEPLTFNVAFAGKVLEVASANNRLPFDLSVRYDAENGDLSGALSAVDFSPASLISLAGELSDYQKWLSVKIAGALSFEQDSRAGFSYAASLTGNVPAEFPTGHATFAIAGNGNEQAVMLSKLSVQMPLGKFGFRGRVNFSPFAPTGTLTLADVKLSKTEKVDATLRVLTKGREIDFTGDVITVGNALLVQPMVKLFLEDGGLSWTLAVQDIHSAVAADAPPVLAEEDWLAPIFVEGSFEYKPQNIEARLVLNKIAIADVLIAAAPFVGIPVLSTFAADIIGNTTASTEIFVSTDFKHFLYNAPQLSLSYAGAYPLDVHMSLSGTNQRLELNEGHVIWDSGDVDMGLYLDFANQNDITFGLSVSYLETNYGLEGTIMDKNSITIQGSYGISANVSILDGEISGYLEVERVPAIFWGQLANISIQTSLRYDSPESWFIRLDNFELANVATPLAASNTIQLQGTVDQNSALFPFIFLNDGQDALSGSSTFFWDAGFSTVSGTAALNNETGSEQYRLTASCTDVFSNDRTLTARLDGFGMRLAHFTLKSYDIVVSGSLQAHWESIHAFTGSVNLSSLTARFADTPFQLSGSAIFDNEKAILRDLNVHYGALNGTIPVFLVNLGENRAETDFAVQGTALGRTLELSCTVNVAFNPIDSWFDISHIIDAFTGNLGVHTVRFGVLQVPEPFSFDFFHIDKVIALSGGPGDMLRFQISDSGDFYAGLSKPSPVRGSIAGNLNAKTIDAVAPDLYIDLSSLWDLLPAQKDIIVTSGFVNASIAVKGPISSPEFSGEAIGNSVSIQVPQFLKQNIRPVPINVTLTGNEMSFGPLPAAVGIGAGMVSGWFQFDRWIPSTFTINIEVPQKTPVPFDFDLMGIIARGDAAGNLHLNQENNIFHVSGDLMAQDTEITLNMEELEMSQSMVLDPSNLTSLVDITVRTGRKVEFLWPLAEFPIIQAYADMGTALTIESDSSSGKFALIGDVNLRSGEIFYFERSFYLQTGTLIFNENEIQFDPHISARAESRDRTDSGPVTISMIIDNASLSSFTARFETSPPLSQVAIFSLLGQTMIGGTSTEADGNSVQNAFLASSADILAQTQVVRHLERQVRNWLHLDMFSVRTQVLQNIILLSPIFQNQTQSEDQALVQNRTERRNGIGNYFDNTTVFIGKYIGAAMFTQGMLSLRYDENKQSTGGLAFEFDIGIELRSPLFNIRWNFVPLHPESLYVEDISFTLTWRKSF